MPLTDRDYRKFFEHYFERLRPDGKGEAKVRCPFHEDKNPSLSVNLKDGVWCCHAGCGGGGIIAFEQRRNGGSWQEARERTEKIVGHKVGNVKREIARVYPWTDEKGKLLYEHVRYEPKDFKWRRPNGKDGYIWSLGKVRRVLWNLPEVVKAEQVFLCEGEKDCETLRRLGLTATTSGDAPNSWRDDFAEFLKEKDVVAFPDNDQPGRELMERAAKILYGVARSLKVVNLPGLPDKGDVSDWLAQGGENSKGKLLSLAERAQPWKPSEGGAGTTAAKRKAASEPKIPTFNQAEEKLPDGRVAEIVATPKGDGTRFCIFRPGTKEVSFLEEIRDATRIIKPAGGSWVKDRALSLPTEPDFTEPEPQKLFTQLVGYIERFFEGDSSLLYVSALYAMLTWRIHQINEVPYLRVLGEPGSGKSRWLLASSLLCYRAALPSVDFTESPLFRLLDAVHEATFAIDEADRKTALHDPFTQFMRAGMERDKFVWRSDPTGEGQAHEPRPFPCFGPKLLAAARPFRDDALESRTLSFSLPLRDVPERISVNTPPEQYTESTKLRNLLFGYRVMNYAKADAFRERMRTAADKMRAARMEGRAMQIGTALLAIASEVEFPPARDACFEVLKQHSEGISQGRRESLSGVLKEVLAEIHKEGRTEIPMNELHQLVCDRARGRGLGHVSADGTPKDVIRSQSFSRMLRKQAKQFGVSVDDRLHGHDQPRVRIHKI